MAAQENGYAPDTSLPDTSLIDPRAPWYDGDGSAHVVQCYEDDSFLVETMSRLIGNALSAGNAVVVIATGHIGTVCARTNRRGQCRCCRELGNPARSTRARGPGRR
jgi:hypothetical protein